MILLWVIYCDPDHRLTLGQEISFTVTKAIGVVPKGTSKVSMSKVDKVKHKGNITEHAQGVHNAHLLHFFNHVHGISLL